MRHRVEPGQPGRLPALSGGCCSNPGVEGADRVVRRDPAGQQRAAGLAGAGRPKRLEADQQGQPAPQRAIGWVGQAACGRRVPANGRTVPLRRPTARRRRWSRRRPSVRSTRADRARWIACRSRAETGWRGGNPAPQRRCEVGGRGRRVHRGARPAKPADLPLQLIAAMVGQRIPAGGHEHPGDRGGAGGQPADRTLNLQQRRDQGRHRPRARPRRRAAAPAASWSRTATNRFFRPNQLDAAAACAWLCRSASGRSRAAGVDHVQPGMGGGGECGDLCGQRRSRLDATGPNGFRPAPRARPRTGRSSRRAQPDRRVAGRLAAHRQADAATGRARRPRHRIPWPRLRTGVGVDIGGIDEPPWMVGRGSGRSGDVAHRCQQPTQPGQRRRPARHPAAQRESAERRFPRRSTAPRCAPSRTTGRRRSARAVGLA